MGDEHHAAAPALQERFEPIDGFDVEVVGRFVQQQHVGAGHQRTGQQHAALHAAGQAAELGVAVEVELGQGFADALVQSPAVGGVDLRLHVAECFAIEHLGVAEVMELGQPLAQFAQAVGDDVEHRTGGAVRHFLLQAGDAHALLHADFAVIGLVVAGQQLEQGGFAGAVAAD
ncbi:hypothetical protein G6F46_013641 [Rhizopus delemar]|nr:hypothetical protein G6F46_013641 [Rhizopus delemar]